MPYQENSSTPGEYRETTNVLDEWKVDMSHSTECVSQDCITTYWLEKAGGVNVSSAVDISSNYGPVYMMPHESANQQTVYLTAENNTWDSNRYEVDGIWDEETW